MMTAQMQDEVVFRGVLHTVVGISGRDPFDPRDHGVVPFPASPACWRGYVVRYYHPHSHRLRVRELRARDDSEQPPLVGGVPPVLLPDGPFNLRWRGLAIDTDFTGGLLLCRHFIRRYQGYFRVLAPWMYGSVFELSYHRGTLVKTTDHSSEMVELRDRHPEGVVPSEAVDAILIHNRWRWES